MEKYHFFDYSNISSFAHVSAMQFVASRLNLTHSLSSSSWAQKFISSSLPPFFARRMPSLSAHVSVSDVSSLHVPLDDVAREALADLNVYYDYKPTPTPSMVCTFLQPLSPSYPLPLSLLPSLLSRGQLTNFDKQKNKPAVLFEYEVQSLFELECGLCGALQQVIAPLPPALFSLSPLASLPFLTSLFLFFFTSVLSPHRGSGKQRGSAALHC